jgi:hypothetical protein
VTKVTVSRRLLRLFVLVQSSFEFRQSSRAVLPRVGPTCHHWSPSPKDLRLLCVAFMESRLCEFRGRAGSTQSVPVESGHPRAVVRPVSNDGADNGHYFVKGRPECPARLLAAGVSLRRSSFFSGTPWTLGRGVEHYLPYALIRPVLDKQIVSIVHFIL